MDCRLGGKHSRKCGIRNTKSDSGGSRAAGTAALSIGRKRSTLRFDRCRADVHRTSCTPGRAQRQLLMDGTAVKSAFCVTFDESNKADALYPALITTRQGRKESY